MCCVFILNDTKTVQCMYGWFNAVLSSKAVASNENFLNPECELLNDQNMIPWYALKGNDVIYFRFRKKNCI